MTSEVIKQKLVRILPRVQKPARYTGGEFGMVTKDYDAMKLNVAFCFPDVYEVGMSHLGGKILAGVINEMPDVWCQRAYAPWPDMESEMRNAGIPLYAVESFRPLKDFDVVAFTTQHELCYTNILNMLDLAEIPVRNEDRCEDDPIIMAGGPCAFNPEPMYRFIDIFSVGEGEESLPETLELLEKCKEEKVGRKEFLRRAAQIKGNYVPSLYDVEWNEDGTVKSITASGDAPAVVEKRIIDDLDKVYFMKSQVVPSTEVIHDRVTIELFRGCIRGCRFCQAGYANRPIRAKRPETLIEDGIRLCKQTGYEEISMLSLSTSDYRGLGELTDGLLDWCEPRAVSLALPSLRADSFSQEIMDKVSKTRGSGLTFAPEAGTDRLRDVINKNLTEDEIFNACRIAFENGRNSVKLYFMIGLPTETDEDVLGIADLAQRILHEWRMSATNKARGPKISVSAACFVPKPQTPFQWEAQNSKEEFLRKAELLKQAINSRSISYAYHEPYVSVLEAAMARGDRRIADVIETAWKMGERFDSWEEYFSYDRWMEAFKACGLDFDFYAAREREEDEVLPWSHISCGVRKDYLLSERHKAYEGVTTPDCRTQCHGCGASNLRNGGRCDA